MEKKISNMLVVVFLSTVVISSLIIPIYSSDIQHSVNASSTTMSNPQPLVTVITEDVYIFPDGSCQLDFSMIVLNSSLSQVYREFFGFPGDIPEPEKINIPESVTFDDTITVGDNVTHTVIDDAPAPVPVKELFLNGIIQEHNHSLGIHIRLEDIDVAETWGVNGECIVAIHATASVQVVGSGEVAIGPLNLDASFDRAGFILTKIGHIQQMLESFDGEQTYNSTWVTNFFLPDFVTNSQELIGKSWSQDFGNGTSLEADLNVPGSQIVVLTERMSVAEKPISVMPEELFEDRFHCYKVFHIEYWTPGAQATSNPPSTYSERKDVSEMASGMDPGWSVDLLDEKFSLSITEGTLVDVTLHVHPRFTLSGHVSWEFKYFRLRKFKAWTKLDADIDMELEVFFGIDKIYKWERPLIWRSRRFYFTVGTVPVELTLNFTATAYLEVDVKAGVDVTFPANATGSMKAGVGWERKKGWYPIREADMNVETSPPTITINANATVTPSVGFRLTLLFYETAGPFIEFEPYATLILNPFASSGYQWGIEVGLNVNAGVEFGRWLRAILGLKKWSWEVYNYVFWECWECDAVKPHDVAVTDVRAPEKAFVTETVSVYVDVLNKGGSPEDVSVTLSYWNSSQWIPIGSKQVNNLPKGSSNTTSFNWDTSSIGWNPGSYAIKANASIQVDGAPGDNINTTSVDLEVRNVRIVNVTTNKNQVFEGQSVKIVVTVENNGTVAVPALPVFAYYGTPPQPISDIWCEYMRMVFDLPAGGSEVLAFRWDTTGVGLGTYLISANTSILPYEMYVNDNTMVDGDVTVIGPPPPGYTVDLAIVSIVHSKMHPYMPAVVGKGFAMHIDVTVENQGTHVEAFDVTAYANKIIISTQIVALANGSSTTVTFPWNTAGKEPKGTYAIIATAIPLPLEIDTTDNTMVDGTVILAMLCDVAGSTTIPPSPSDGIVDCIDLFWLGKAYGSDPSRDNWNPNLDFAGSTTWLPAPPDGVVDNIDLSWMSKYYGKTDP